MTVSAAHRRHWQQRFQAEAAAIAARRRLAEQQAQAAAEVLRDRWPQVQGVWMFGSVLEPGFGLGSDLDLCVEGLPSDALLAAIELLNATEVVAVPAGPLPIDLVRLEALPPHWQERLRQRGRALS